ncbi:MAG: glycosyl hydrolase family 38 [Bacteroidales bacterium]|nr:glycosyl hydrolase family 38 [Bacteroidales bacterium]
MTRKLAALFVFILVSLTSNAQHNELILSGYQKTIIGEPWTYDSSIPILNKSILVRATDGNYYMAWETASVPETLNGTHIQFVWYAGLGSGSGQKDFYLFVNDQKISTFQTKNQNTWSVAGKNDIELKFEKHGEDPHGDIFGFMFLKVPVQHLKKGSSLNLKITGSASSSQAWVMVFTNPLEEKLIVDQPPAQLKTQEKFAIHAECFYWGKPELGTLSIGSIKRKQKISTGYNSFLIPIPENLNSGSAEISLKLHGVNMKNSLELAHAAKRIIYFVQHSHTDIGYTRPQTEILGEHIRYIDYALDYCDATDHLPAEEQFKWTCEASWAVEEFLKARPASQIDRLKKRIDEGRIEVTGMHFNFDELPDEQALAQSLMPLKTFQDFDIPIELAMQNDVNGIAWCMNDYFSQLGVKYLNMGTHGHRALICFNKPTAFWWESPAGNKILTFRAEHYMTGNVRFQMDGSFHQFEQKVMEYLKILEALSYPHLVIPIQHSGYLTDNAPPSTRSSEVIRMWNEKYEWPKMQTAVASEFFKFLEKEGTDDLPVYRMAWPDWWTDGFASGAREMSVTRQGHTKLIAAQGALSMAKLLGAQMPEEIFSDLEMANEALLFYGEHTFGASESISDPFSKNTMDQRYMKASYAWEALRRANILTEKGLGLLQGYVQHEEHAVIAVFNTLPIKRTALTTIYIDHQILPRNKSCILSDEEGNQVPAQALNSRSDGTYWSIEVPDIPAFGYKKLKLQLIENSSRSDQILHQLDRYENDYYSINLDTIKGTITKLKDKELNLNLLDTNSQWDMGEFIHEIIKTRKHMPVRDDLASYEGLENVIYKGIKKGSVWDEITFTGESSTLMSPQGYEFTIRVFHSTKKIDFLFRVDKKLLTTPEGIYVAFPFGLNDGRIFFDVPGGAVEAGVNQLPGSSNDWNTIQNFVSIENDQVRITLTPHEAPIMHLGGLNLGRYEAGAKPESMQVFGWPMHNQWQTNFNADQHGEFNWSYSLTSGKKSGDDHGSEFAWNQRIPVLTRVLPPTSHPEKGEHTLSLLQNWPENVQLIKAFPTKTGKGILLQTRETQGKEAHFLLENKDGEKLGITKVNILGEPIDMKNSNTILPLESAFFILDLN